MKRAARPKQWPQQSAAYPDLSKILDQPMQPKPLWQPGVTWTANGVTVNSSAPYTSSNSYNVSALLGSVKQ